MQITAAKPTALPWWSIPPSPQQLERLRTALADNILTDEVRRNGLGGVDPARLERSIGQVAQDFKFRNRPAAAEIFDDQFLPPLAGRVIN